MNAKLVYFKRNPMLIALLFLISLMFGIPHLINISKIPYGLYNPFPVQNGLILNMDENLFAPGFRDAADGHLIVRNPQLKEYKNLPSHLDVFPFLVIGFVASLFSVGAKEIFIVSDFIFPPLVFLMFFIVARRIFSLRTGLAALSALLIVLFQSFTNFIRAIITLNIEFFNFFSATDFLGYSKLYSPEFIAIPFLAALLVLYLAFKNDRPAYGIAASLLGALLFYTYFYYSTFFWATFLILSVFELHRKGINALKKIFLILIPAAVLSVPYVLNFIAFSGSEAYRDVLLRAGLESGRFIHTAVIYAAISIAFLVVSYRVMKNRFLFFFVASMLLSATMLMNMQVITGYSVQPWHWGYRVLEFLYFFIAAYLIQTGLASGRKNIAVTKALIIVFVIYGLGYSVSAAYATSDIYALTEGEADLYRWLNNNTPADSAVMTLSMKESLHIPSFTHNNVYLPDGITSGRPTEELVDRFVFAHVLYGAVHSLAEKLNVSNDAFRLEYLNRLYEGKRFNLRDFEKYYFINYFFHTQFFYGRHDYQQKNPDIPGAIGFYFPLSFREYAMQKLQSQSYKIYDFDYVLVGPYEREVGSSMANNYTKVYSNSEFDVYAVRK